MLRVSKQLIPPQFTKQKLLHSPKGKLIISIILLFLILQVLQGLRFHVDGEVPALVAADGNPVEAHLPAVQIAVDADVGVSDIVVDEVPTGGEGDLPFGGDIDVAIEAERVHMGVGGDAHEGSISY